MIHFVVTLSGDTTSSDFCGPRFSQLFGAISSQYKHGWPLFALNSVSECWLTKFAIFAAIRKCKLKDFPGRHTEHPSVFVWHEWFFFLDRLVGFPLVISPPYIFTLIFPGVFDGMFPYAFGILYLMDPSGLE